MPKSEFAHHALRAGLERRALKLHTRLFLPEALNAVQFLDEIEMPEGAAKFAVGDGIEADLFLHPDDLADFPVLGGVQFIGGDQVCLAFEPRLLEGQVRKRLPTISARKGGLLLIMMVFPFWALFCMHGRQSGR